MREGAAFRGQPLLLLAGLLVGWAALRAALWQLPFVPPMAFPPAPWRRPVHLSPSLGAGTARERAEQVRHAPGSSWLPAPASPTIVRISPWSIAPTPRLALPLPSPAAGVAHPLEDQRVAVGQALLLLAGMAEMEVPSAIFSYFTPPASAPGVPHAATSVASLPSPRASAPRWSADGWLLLRQDSATALGPGQPSYGRSQVGAVVRYRLGDGPQRPQAYLRASAALVGARDEQLAAGVSARPLAAVPVRVAAEARLAETSRGSQVSPVVFAVTELPQAKLPLDVRAQVYAQAGYVGGAYATAFVDGQARVEREIARLGDGEVTGGAGVWGGAQKGAGRLDVGPTAAVSFRLGETRGRVAADYRFRVAGDAQPASGPALTVSAGF